jgi:signal transduction histidine kinase
MKRVRRVPGLWLAGAWALTLAGIAVLAWLEFGRLREAFDTDARIVHRLLSQRAVEHDAILATLTLLQPASQRPGADPEQRLPALYAQILSVQRRNPGGTWPDADAAALTAAEAVSRSQRRAALAPADLSSGRFRLVLGADPASFALTIDLRAMVPWADWPMRPASSPVRVTLEHGGQAFVLQPGQPAASSGMGWPLAFRKALATESQPFAVVAQRRLGVADLPWLDLLAWTIAVWSTLAGALHLQRQRSERRRVEGLLRLGQVARLNTLGEMAAGLAHELNQPLSAVLANTQAARRLLQDEPPDLDTARSAMQQAVEQARRAADVVGRLRRSIERPDGAPAAVQATDLAQAVRRALDLLEPDVQRSALTPTVHATVPVQTLADPVALEQILHNLLTNALQALEPVPPAQRRLRVDIEQRDGAAELRVSDSGPGLPGDLPTRIFEPFYSSRAGGLGLGLSLSESLAHGMGGSLTARHLSPNGAEFCLRLPPANPAP